MSINNLVFGKDSTENIVCVEVNDTHAEIFREVNGVVTSEFTPSKLWFASTKSLDEKFIRLDGNLPYKYIRYFDSVEDLTSARKIAQGKSFYHIWDTKEMHMVPSGITYFKNSKIDDVSVLAFDIESTGLVHDSTSKVLLISNTFRKQGKVIRKLFCYDEYDNDAEFFDAWCEWVREINPSIILGHNIVLYDLPYLNYCAKKAGTSLRLGRDASDIKISTKESKFRKDGSQFYTYNRISIYGRETIDTFFLALKYDVGRKYDSYKLKTIIKQEGLEKQGRQFYDAGNIRTQYRNPEEWVKIKEYCKDDSDDALALYDLMIPSYFYLTRSTPKSFQGIIEGATGSQINSIMVRAYLQDGHSLPFASDQDGFEGAISIGNPGVYTNVFKIDVASLYPNIMLQYNVFDKYKDPKGYFTQILNYFTSERLANKRLAKESGDRHYGDLEQSQKIVANSSYGFMGAPGLLFNSPANAAFVTRKGREILSESIKWAEENDFIIVNADTDSISITHKDGGGLSPEEQQVILNMVNSLFPERIKFEHDGYYDSVVVLKAKNYALKQGDKVKIKGSALKATMKERALQDFIRDVIKLLLVNAKDDVITLYNSYAKEIIELKDISRWSSKKTITDKVLNPERSNEEKVLDAIEGTEYVEGDKIRVYFTVDKKLKLEENWNGDHDVDTLLNKLHSTIKIFDSVLDLTKFPNYKLKKSKALLTKLCA